MKELLQRVDAQEICQQMAYYLIEPWGDRRADLRAAIIANTVARTQGCHTTPKDFIPEFGIEDEEEKRQQVAEKLKLFFTGVAMQNGAKAA